MHTVNRLADLRSTVDSLRKRGPVALVPTMGALHEGHLTLVREATSFGGVHSTAERRARWGGDAVGEGFIRFSVGCEAPEDILEDVANALQVTM